MDKTSKLVRVSPVFHELIEHYKEDCPFVRNFTPDSLMQRVNPNTMK